jgi:hypothetical protein
MKNLIYSICLFTLGALFLTSCSEEINLKDGFTETPVVYGLLDQADSIHFIKINRAFIGPGNWIEIAQIPDSSLYDVNHLTATITEIGGLNRTWPLKDTLIENKDQNGIWYAPEQTVYYFKTETNEPLNASATYKLDISINDGAIKVSGETKLVNGMMLDSNTPSSAGFALVTDPGEYAQTSIKLSSNGNAAIINASVEVNYAEVDAGIVNERSFLWKFGEAEVSSGFGGFSISGESFYTLMKNSVSTSNTVTRRLFRGFKIILVGGAEELYNYMTVNKPVSTLAQSKPTYTNLEVTGTKRVVGIFSSRQTLTISKPFYVGPQQAYIRSLNPKSTQELCQGPITGSLLFCSDHPGDTGGASPKPYACQ